MRHAALRAVTESCLTKGRPRLGAVYPRHRGNPQGRRESAPTDRAVQEEEGSWVQCLKGLPLKINEKYTEIRHLWSGKFARKTQRAVFCLNESIWSNSLVRKKGGSGARERKCRMTEFILLWRSLVALQWKDEGFVRWSDSEFLLHLHKEMKPFSMNEMESLTYVTCRKKGL